MAFDTTQTDQHDIAVTDGHVRYWTIAAGRTIQQIADAFLQGYYIDDEEDDAPVRFTVKRVDGTGKPAVFKGRPDGKAVEQ